VYYRPTEIDGTIFFRSWINDDKRKAFHAVLVTTSLDCLKSCEKMQVSLVRTPRLTTTHGKKDLYFLLMHPSTERDEGRRC
jgi:hypothetical protein